MATPNYGYEKRQRELEKKRKKEEKARAKAARKSGAVGDGGDAPALENDAIDGVDATEGGGDAGGDGGGGDGGGGDGGGD